MQLDVRPDAWATYAQALGLRLQQHRMAAGLTQESLAHAVGLTRTHYQQIEWGRWGPGKPANPTIKVLVVLAQHLGVEVGDLVPSVSALETASGD